MSIRIKKKAPVIALLAIYGSLLCVSGKALAQIEGVKEGDRVRISAPSISGTMIEGKVAGMTATQIRVSREDHDPYEIGIQLDAVERLEVGRQVRRTGRGALVGAGIGGFAFAFINAAAFRDHCLGELGCSSQNSGELLLEGARAGIVFGGLIGAVIGTTLKREKWKHIPLELSTSGLALPADGQPWYAPGIRLTLSF